MTSTSAPTSVPPSGGAGTTLQEEKDSAMMLLENEPAISRMRELRAEAEVAARARRLYLARKAARRAERATRRAARASAAVM